MVTIALAYRQRLQQRRYRGEFVGFLAGGLLSQHHPDASGQGADQMQRPPPLAPAAPAGLAIHGHHRARLQRRDQARDPLPKAPLHGLRIEQPQYPSQGVVRSDAMFKLHEAPQPLQPCLGPQFDLHEIVCPAQHRAYRHHQHFHQIVRAAPHYSWIDYHRKRLGQTHRLSCRHRRPKKTGNYTACAQSTSPVSSPYSYSRI